MGSKKVKVGEGSALAGANEAPLHFPGSSPQTSPLARGLDPVVASQPTTTPPAFGGNPTAHAILGSPSATGGPGARESGGEEGWGKANP